MIGNIARLLGAAAIVTMAYVPFHGQTYASPDKPFIAVGGQSLTPYGWADFCVRYVGECDGGRMTPMDVDFTPQAMKRLQQVNSFVNKTIKPMSDMEHWGVVDQWDYPSDGYGDCEDYALLKRRILMDDGFPRQALLMTVVKDTHGEGHAVLTVKTSVGEFILDNFDNEVRPWSQSKYQFIKRQSQADQNVWVSIGDQPAAAPLIVSR
jgi:predicted transglutaminase-like cysteine proteinase